MAAPSYNTDLTPIILDMGGTTGWTALGGGASGLVAPETDFYIQGNNCISKAGWSSATKGMIYSAGAQTIASGKAVFMWVYYWAPNSLNTEASGGLQVLVGSASNAFNQFYVGGSDTLTYGGWLCAVVDPALSADNQTGTPTGTSFFGAQAFVPSTGPSKGQPLGIDAIRHGRELQITNGDLANGYATFDGAATFDNEVTRRWGLIIKRDGAYYQQGLFAMGQAGTAVDFRDANRIIFIQNTKKVSSSFNAFEVLNASSRVDWTAISITALGTVSKGNFIVTDNADVNKDSCTFTDMGTFTYQSNSTIIDSTFRRCDQITLGGATMSGCLITRSTAAIALFAGSSVSSLSNTAFISSGTGHAIEINATGIYTLNGITFTGYAASNGSTGNEAVFVNVASGSVTINSDSALSYRLPVGSTATVTVVAGQKTLSVTNVVSGSDVVILAAGTSTVLASNDGATNPVTSFDYSYTYAAGTFVDITVYLAGYVPYIVRNFLLPANGGSVQVAQVLDRNYTP